MPHAHLERERVIGYIPRSLPMNMTMCRTVGSGRLSTLMNVPPPASAKPGIVPGLIP